MATSYRAGERDTTVPNVPIVSKVPNVPAAPANPLLEYMQTLTKTADAIKATLAPVAPTVTTPPVVDEYGRTVVTKTDTATGKVTKEITSAGGSSTVIKNDTNATNQNQLAAYEALHPAPEGFHYGEKPNPDGTFVLFYNFDNPDNPSTKALKNAIQPVDNPIKKPTTPALNTTTVAGPSTDIDVLKSLLLGRGYPSSLVDESVPYLSSLLKDGLAPSDAVEIYLNAKNYTTKSGNQLTSPFYNTYGKFNEGLKTPYDAGTLFQTVEGYKNIQGKYHLNSNFFTDNSIKQYLSNNIDVKTLDERANAARLKAVTADPVYVSALQKLGYINNAQDLTDFYLDPTIGTEALTQKRNTAAFATEALRQANLQNGVQFREQFVNQMGAELTNKGYSENQIANLAQSGYQNIAAQLGTTTKLSGIYQGPNAGTSDQIQQELQAQEFQGLDSQRRALLNQQEIQGFQGSAGLSGTSAYLRKTSLQKPGVIGML
jgi:hypothetical protein